MTPGLKPLNTVLWLSHCDITVHQPSVASLTCCLNTAPLPYLYISTSCHHSLKLVPLHWIIFQFLTALTPSWIFHLFPMFSFHCLYLSQISYHLPLTIAMVPNWFSCMQNYFPLIYASHYFRVIFLKHKFDFYGLFI